MQCLATGLDEDYRKPKNMTDQIVRTLDDEEITPADRLRLVALYVLFKNGILPADLQKLLFHAQLPPTDESPDSSKRKETLRHRFSRLSQPRHQMLRITACPGSIPRCRIC